MTHAEVAGRKQRIAEAIAGGESFGKVCTRFQVSVNYAQQACRSRGVDYPRDGGRTPSYAVLAALQNTSDSFNKIGKVHHISRQAVFSVISRARAGGVRFPNRPEKVSEREC